MSVIEAIRDGLKQRKKRTGVEERIKAVYLGSVKYREFRRELEARGDLRYWAPSGLAAIYMRPIEWEGMKVLEVINESGHLEVVFEEFLEKE